MHKRYFVNYKIAPAYGFVSIFCAEWIVAEIDSSLSTTGLEIDGTLAIPTALHVKLNQQVYKSLDGFVIVIAKEGFIVYISENVERYLGLSQVI